MSLISKEQHLLSYIYLLGNLAEILEFHDRVFKRNMYLKGIINCNTGIAFVFSAHFAKL